MKNKYLVLIPTLFLLASCGANAEARVLNANDVSDNSTLRSMDYNDYNDICSSARKNTLYATEISYEVSDRYEDIALFYNNVKLNYQRTDRQVMHYAYYEDDMAFAAEIYEYCSGDLISEHELNAMEQYCEFEEVKDSETYGALEKTFVSSRFNGYVQSPSTCYADRIALEDAEDAKEEFEIFARRSLTQVAYSFIYEATELPTTYYKMDGNKICFQYDNYVSTSSIENNSYGSFSGDVQYISAIMNLSYKVVYEKVENGYRFLEITSDGTYSLVADNFGRLLKEPVLYETLSATMKMSYDKVTGYQKKNMTDFLPDDNPFEPVLTYFYNIPSTNKDTNTNYDNSSDYSGLLNNSREIRHSVGLPVDTMAYVGDLYFSTGEFISFESSVNRENHSTACQFEFVNLVGEDYVSAKDIPGVGTIIEIVSDCHCFAEIELKVSYDYLTEEATSTITKVTFLPVY